MARHARIKFQRLEIFYDNIGPVQYSKFGFYLPIRRFRFRLPNGNGTILLHLKWRNSCFDIPGLCKTFQSFLKISELMCYVDWFVISN